MDRKARDLESGRKKLEEDMLAAVRRARPHLVVVNTDRMLSRAAGVTCVYVPGDAEDQLYQRCSHEAVPAMHVGAVQAVSVVKFDRADQEDEELVSFEHAERTCQSYVVVGLSPVLCLEVPVI